MTDEYLYGDWWVSHTSETYSSDDNTAVFLFRFDLASAAGDAPSQSAIINQYITGSLTVKITGIQAMSSRDNERLLVVFETDSNSTTVTIGGIYNHFRLIQVKFRAS